MADKVLGEVVAQISATRDAVRAQMNSATDPAQSDKLFLQIIELTHRITMLNQLMFKDGSKNLDGELDQIKQATADVKKAIKEVQGIANVVSAVRSLLGIADTIIGLLM